jgi:hypothetical protein
MTAVSAATTSATGSTVSNSARPVHSIAPPGADVKPSSDIAVCQIVRMTR